MAAWEAVGGQREERVVEFRPSPAKQELCQGVEQHAAWNRERHGQQPAPVAFPEQHERQQQGERADGRGIVQAGNQQHDAREPGRRVPVEPTGDPLINQGQRIAGNNVFSNPREQPECPDQYDSACRQLQPQVAAAIQARPHKGDRTGKPLHERLEQQADMGGSRIVHTSIMNLYWSWAGIAVAPATMR